MTGRSNWAQDVRVYNGGDNEPEQQEKVYDALQRVGKGILTGFAIGGGIEVALHIIQGIEEMPYCSKEEFLYRFGTGIMTAALLMPIGKEKEVIEYWRKAYYSGLGYAIGAMEAFSGLEKITQIYLNT